MEMDKRLVEEVEKARAHYGPEVSGHQAKGKSKWGMPTFRLTLDLAGGLIDSDWQDTPSRAAAIFDHQARTEKANP